MAHCVNRSSKEFQTLAETTNINPIILAAKVSLWQEKNGLDNFPSIEDIYPSGGVNFNLKALDILGSQKAIDIFAKGKKNGWPLEKILSELQVPKEQSKLIIDSGKTTLDDIITDLLANYSYAIEINTAKERDIANNLKTVGNNFSFNGINFTSENIPNTFKSKYYKDGAEISKEDYLDAKIAKQNEVIPTTNTQVYSNLTVPGGTNYTEQEIATPAITPSIKGHAQFATDKGIGWFRSDDKVDNASVEVGREIEDEYDEMGRNIGRPPLSQSFTQEGGTETKTRRILEVQSDLFQKGRDKEILTGQYEEARLVKGYPQYDLQKEAKENKFLQLLNKDNNWVNFFVKSIIQDSAKKGYEKVLFPSGDTASKVEGHTTLEEFKKQKEDRIKELESRIGQKTWVVQDEVGQVFEIFTDYDKANKFYQSNDKYSIKETDRSKYKEVEINEINQLKQELERVDREGFASLKPIYNFYENTVKNVLSKQYGKENIKEITDEHGNTWNEVDIKEEYANSINFSIAPVNSVGTTLSPVNQLGVKKNSPNPFETVNSSSSKGLKLAKALGLNTEGNKITLELSDSQKQYFTDYYNKAKKKAYPMDTNDGFVIDIGPNFYVLRREKDTKDIVLWVDTDSGLYKVKLDHLFLNENKTEKGLFKEEVKKKNREISLTNQAKNKRLLISEKRISDKLVSSYYGREMMQVIKNQILSVLNQTSSDLNSLKLDEETFKKYKEKIEELGKDLESKVISSEQERLKKSPEELVQKLLQELDKNTMTVGELNAVTALLEQLPVPMLSRMILNSQFGLGYFATNIVKELNSSPEVEKRMTSVFNSFANLGFQSTVGSLYSFMETYPNLNITKEDIEELNKKIISDFSRGIKKNKKKYVEEFLERKAVDNGLSKFDVLSDFYTVENNFQNSAKKYAEEEFPEILELFKLLKHTYYPYFFSNKEYFYEIAYNYEFKTSEKKYTPSVVLSHELGHYFDNVLADTDPELRKAFRDFSRDLVEMAPDFAERGNNTLQEYVDKGLLIRGYALNNYHEVIPDVIGTLLLTGSGQMTRNKSTQMDYMYKVLTTSDGNLQDLFDKHFEKFFKEEGITQEDIDTKSFYTRFRDFIQKIINKILRVNYENLVVLPEQMSVLEQLSNIFYANTIENANFIPDKKAGKYLIDEGLGFGLGGRGIDFNTVDDIDFSLAPVALDSTNVFLEPDLKTEFNDELGDLYRRTQPVLRENAAEVMTNYTLPGGEIVKRSYTEVYTPTEGVGPTKVIVKQTAVKIETINALGIAKEMIDNANRALLHPDLIANGVTLGTIQTLPDGNVAININTNFKSILTNSTSVHPSNVNLNAAKYYHLSTFLGKRGLSDQYAAQLKDLFEKGEVAKIIRQQRELESMPDFSISPEMDNIFEDVDFSIATPYADNPSVYSVPNFIDYSDKRRKQIKKINVQIDKLRTLRKIEGDVQEVTKRINYLENLKTELEQEILNFEVTTSDISKFNEIVKFFEKDFERINELLNNPTVENMQLAKDMLEYLEINSTEHDQIGIPNSDNKIGMFDLAKGEISDPAVKELKSLIHTQKEDLKRKYNDVTDDLLIELMEPLKDNFLKMFPGLSLEQIRDNHLKANLEDISGLEKWFFGEGDTLVSKSDLLSQMKKIIFEMENHKKQAQANIVIQKINKMLPQLQAEMQRQGFISQGILDYINYVSLFYRKNSAGIVEPYLVSKFTQAWDSFIYSVNADANEELKKAFSTTPIGNINAVLANKYTRINEKADFVDFRYLHDLYPAGTNTGFDLYKLGTAAEADAYKADLISRIGEIEYEEILNKQRNFIEEFEEEALDIRNKFFKEKGVPDYYSLSASDQQILDHRLDRINPYVLLESHTNGNFSFIPFQVGTMTYTNNHFIKYNTYVPRRVDTKGRDTGFFDANFDIIENNDVLKEAWEVFQEACYTINSNLIDSQLNLNKKSLLWFQKSMKEALLNKEWSEANKGLSLSGTYQNSMTLLRSIADTTRQLDGETEGIRLPENVASYQNQVNEVHNYNVMRLSSILKIPITNKSKIPYNSLTLVDKQTLFEELGVEDETDFLNLVPLDQNGNFNVKDLKIFAKRSVAQDQTLDLPTMLKVLLEQSAIHGARSATKDKIETLIYKSNQQKAMKGSYTSKQKRTRANERSKFWVDTVVDNKTDMAQWGLLSKWARKMKKIYDAGGSPTIEDWKEGLNNTSQNLTPEEKKTYAIFIQRLQDIDEMLATITDAESIERLEQERFNIEQKLRLMGKDYMASALLTSAMTKYQIAHGMMYNIVSPLFNLVNARMQLMNRDGEFWSMGNSFSALNFVGMRSTRFASKEYKQQWQIMEAIVERLNIISDGTNEFQRAERTGVGKAPSVFGKVNVKGVKIPALNKKFITDPLFGTAAIEYYNQVPAFLCMAMDKGILNNVTGEIDPLFDGVSFKAYQIGEDGQISLKPEYDSEENRADFLNFNSEAAALWTTQIKNAIDSINGDYRGSGVTMAKKEVFLKQLMAFKTWVPKYMQARYAFNYMDLVAGEARDGYITGSLAHQATKGQGYATFLQTTAISAIMGPLTLAAFPAGMISVGVGLSIITLGAALPIWGAFRAKKAGVNSVSQNPGVFKTLHNALKQFLLTNTVGMVEMPANSAYGLLKKLKLIKAVDSQGAPKKYLIDPVNMIANGKDLSDRELKNITSFVRQAALANFSSLLLLLAQSLLGDDEEDELKGEEGTVQNQYYWEQKQKELDKKFSAKQKFGLALKNSASRSLSETNLATSPTDFMNMILGDDSTALSGAVPIVEALGELALSVPREDSTDEVTDPNSMYYGDSKTGLALRRALLFSSIKNVDKDQWSAGFEGLYQKDRNKSLWNEIYNQTDLKKDQKTFNTSKAQSIVDIKEELAKEYYKTEYQKIQSARDVANIDKEAKRRFDLQNLSPKKARLAYDKEQKRIDSSITNEYFNTLKNRD
jgi:hypothetical protein